MSQLRISLLGPPRLEWQGHPIALDRRKGLALVAYLAVGKGPILREELATMFWPDYDRERAFASLRRTLAALNQTPLNPFLQADRKSIGLTAGEGLWVDVREFETRLQSLDKEEEEPGQDPHRKLLPLAQAVNLYRGEFLSGLTLRDSTAFDDWQSYQGGRLRQEFGTALERLVIGHSSLGEVDPALQYAQRWLSLDPLQEKVHRVLMSLYASAGRRGEALRQYERCVRILEKELGVEPEEETTRLYEEIKRGALQPESSGTLVLVPEPKRPVHNLPDVPTVFVGRKEELSRIGELLENPSCRLLTLIGPGGIGKTRLALEASWNTLSFFPDGTYFVPLARVATGSLGLAMAESLHLALDPQAPAEVQLIDFLRGKKLLLVLDNFEHLVESSGQVGTLLKALPELKVLVTSREGLRLQGEWLFPVEGLDLPEGEETEDPERYGAVRLFVEAARRVRADFTLDRETLPPVLRICRRVGGMPLGIELAAGWLRVLSCHEIAQEVQQGLDLLSSDMRDLPERHRSLRSVFSYSLDLLSEEERAAFVRLACFRGGFTREAAEAVAGAKLPHLLSLCNKSLLHSTRSGRFEVHALLEEFAEEELDRRRTEKKKVQALHSRYFLEFLARLEPEFKGRDLNRALERVRADLDNVRLAWSFALEHQELEALSGALETLYRFYMISGGYHEGEEVMGAAAEIFRRHSQSQQAARAAARQGRFCIALGLFGRAQELLSSTHRTFQGVQDYLETASVLTHLSALCYHRGEYEKAKSLLEESVAIYRSQGDRHGTASSLNQLGRTMGSIGDYARARLLLNESLIIWEELGDEDGYARCCINLGSIAYLSENYLEAIRLFQEALEIARRLEHRNSIAFCLSNLGLTFERLGEYPQAKEYSQRGLEVLREIGNLEATARGLENMARICFALHQYEESRRYYFETLRTANEIQAIPVALIALLGIARVTAHEGNLQRALELLTVVIDHPKVNREAKVQAEELAARVQKELPSRQRAQAQKRARVSDFQSLVNELLEIFETDVLAV